MNVTAQQTEFLSWKIVPARLDALQAAWFLGFEPHEISMLVAVSLLKPLGHPARNRTKFFATETLEHLRRDEKWLARASDAICIYWRKRNTRKKTACGYRSKKNAPFSRPSAPTEQPARPPSKSAATE
ncbi:MAG: hypothetical protein ABI042_11460 [Verrucomicrobiota bacterium]